MEEYGRILYLFTDLVLPLVVGYVLHRKNLVGNTLVDRLIMLNVRVLGTILSFLSFWVVPISWDLAWLPVFGFLLVLVPGILSFPIALHRYSNALNQGAHLISAMLANIGTLGGICAFILYHEVGFAYTQVIWACQNVLWILVCFPIAQSFRDKHFGAPMEESASRWKVFRERFFGWNQVSLLGMAGGALLNANGVLRPEEFTPVFQWTVHVNAWVGMLPVGFLIDFRAAAPYYRNVVDLIPLRFVILPLLCWYTAHLVFTDTVLLNTLLVIASTPTAINAVLTAQLYRLNVDLVVAAFLLTTVLFLFAVFPVIFCLLSSAIFPT